MRVARLAERSWSDPFLEAEASGRGFSAAWAEGIGDRGSSSDPLLNPLGTPAKADVT